VVWAKNPVLDIALPKRRGRIEARTGLKVAELQQEAGLVRLYFDAGQCQTCIWRDQKIPLSFVFVEPRGTIKAAPL